MTDLNRAAKPSQKVLLHSVRGESCDDKGGVASGQFYFLLSGKKSPDPVLEANQLAILL